jgi:hypothetical protein
MKKIILAYMVVSSTNYFIMNLPASAQNQSISIDKMSRILAALVVTGKLCPQEFRPKDDSPLARILSARGYNLEDFSSGRYEKLMETKIVQTIKYVRSNGTMKGCTSMRNLMQQNLPELYSDSAFAKKIRIANEFVIQHYNCYSKLLESEAGSTEECDSRLRQQLNQNGLCEYAPERIRYRFCKDPENTNI